MKMATRLMLMSDQAKKEQEGMGHYDSGHGYREHAKGMMQHTGQRRFTDSQEAMHYGHEPGYGDDRGEFWPMRKPHGPDPLYGNAEHGKKPRKGYDEDYERQQRHGHKRHHEPDDEDEEDDEGGHIDEWKARKWVSSMQGEGGKNGEYYAVEKARKLMEQHCPECDQWEWYITINMMHSDYGKIAKMLGVDCDIFCAMLAKAFIEDEDAGPDKVRKYMEHIPKK